MQPLINRMTPEVSNNQEKLTEILIPLCTILNEYIPVISEIVQVINRKSDLVNEYPIISTELMEGEYDKAKQIMSYMASSQNRILKEEKQAFTDLHCHNYLGDDDLVPD